MSRLNSRCSSLITVFVYRNTRAGIFRYAFSFASREKGKIRYMQTSLIVFIYFIYMYIILSLYGGYCKMIKYGYIVTNCYTEWELHVNENEHICVNIFTSALACTRLFTRVIAPETPCHLLCVRINPVWE